MTTTEDTIDDIEDEFTEVLNIQAREGTSELRAIIVNVQDWKPLFSPGAVFELAATVIDDMEMEEWTLISTTYSYTDEGPELLLVFEA